MELAVEFVKLLTALVALATAAAVLARELLKFHKTISDDVRDEEEEDRWAAGLAVLQPKSQAPPGYHLGHCRQPHYTRPPVPCQGRCRKLVTGRAGRADELKNAAHFGAGACPFGVSLLREARWAWQTYRACRLEPCPQACRASCSSISSRQRSVTLHVGVWSAEEHLPATLHLCSSPLPGHSVRSGRKVALAQCRFGCRSGLACKPCVRSLACAAPRECSRASIWLSAKNVHRGEGQNCT